MQIVRANPAGAVEKTSKLSVLQAGDVFRFPDVSYEQAISNADDASFYMVINKPISGDTKRVSVLSLDGKTLLERDGDREVIRHQATISVVSNL